MNVLGFLHRCRPSSVWPSHTARSRSYLSIQAREARPIPCSTPAPDQNSSRSRTEQGAWARAAWSSSGSGAHRPGRMVGERHGEENSDGVARARPGNDTVVTLEADCRVTAESLLGSRVGRRAGGSRPRRRTAADASVPARVRANRSPPGRPRDVRTAWIIRGQAKCWAARQRPASPILRRNRCRQPGE